MEGQGNHRKEQKSSVNRNINGKKLRTEENISYILD